MDPEDYADDAPLPDPTLFADFRYRHKDGTWSKWEPVVPLPHVGKALKYEPIGSILAIKQPAKDGYISIRQWKRLS